MLKHSEKVGKFDRKVTLQKQIYSTDASNQRKVLGWEDVPFNPEEWANVEERSGSEIFQADQLTGITFGKITIRFRTDITILHRIIYDNKVYNIHAIIEIGRRRFSQFIVESGGQYKEVEAVGSGFSIGFSELAFE